MSTPVNLISLDFAEIKQSLKDYLRNQSEFTDYNFEGSGLNVLLDVLAYDAQHGAYMANMLANESDLDSAVVRDNVVSRVKILGYTPKSTTAAKAIISVIIDDSVNEATSLLLPRGTKFIAGSGSQTMTFVTLQDYNLFLNENTGLYENTSIEIFEGSIKAVSWQVTEGMRFVLNSTKIFTDSLKVGVFPNYNTSDGTSYTRADNLERIGPSSNVFWIQETDGSRFELLFGDSVFGSPPAIGNIVYAEYLDANGAEANNLSRFSLAGTFAGYENSQITISTVMPSNGGDSIESTSSIKIHAPRAFAAQGKAVTAEDYVAAVNELFPYAKSVSVWGGEEETPPKYSKVFISIISEDSKLITPSNKRDIINKLKRRNVTGVTPVIVDANYIYMNMNAIINIKRNSIGDLKSFSSSFYTLVAEFFSERFSQFNEDFHYSNLVTKIENYSRAVLSARLDYELSIRKSVTDELRFEFGNEIERGTVRSTHIDSDIGESLSISDENGILFLGNSVIGVVDYHTGVIVINKPVTNATGTIEVFIETVNDDIEIKNKSALVLDTDRLSIELKSGK